MPWPRTGTVAVTNGSTTVTGTNADFAVNARNGDSFVGPDGLNYEVTNVANATVISILPAYRGATASGAAYSIMPVQGYDKLLSDAFNNLNNLFGAKLAALGTTGNYDILPATKGGTGLTAVGTAIASNIMTSKVDTTAGRLLRVGDFGVGSLSGGMDFTDANLAIISGIARLNSPYTNGPTAGPYSIIVARYDNEVTQIAFQEGSVFPVFFFRKRSGPTTWGNWRGGALNGANNDITSIAGLTTPLSVAQGGTGKTSIGAASVGTVSQVGGVQTGAILEYVSTGNGDIYKFASGLLIAVRSIADQPFNVAPGQIGFRNDIAMPLVFPTEPIYMGFTGFVTDASGNRYSLPIIDDYAATGASSPGMWCMSVKNTGATAVTRIVKLKLIAIGRWY